MQKYTQLTCEQRYHIYLLNKQGYNQTFIAKSMGLLNYDLMREEFGNDIGVIVAFKDESGIFNKKPLKSIESLTKKSTCPTQSFSCQIFFDKKL
jgi:hypothetical protein